MRLQETGCSLKKDSQALNASIKRLPVIVLHTESEARSQMEFYNNLIVNQHECRSMAQWELR